MPRPRSVGALCNYDCCLSVCPSVCLSLAWSYTVSRERKGVASRRDAYETGDPPWPHLEVKGAKVKVITWRAAPESVSVIRYPCSVLQNQELTAVHLFTFNLSGCVMSVIVISSPAAIFTWHTATGVKHNAEQYEIQTDCILQLQMHACREQ